MKKKLPELSPHEAKQLYFKRTRERSRLVYAQAMAAEGNNMMQFEELGKNIGDLNAEIEDLEKVWKAARV